MTEKNRFKARRLSLGLTQAGLAQRCTDEGAEVSDSQISKIERGLWKPYPPLHRALAAILGDDPVELQPKKPEPSKQPTGAAR